MNSTYFFAMAAVVMVASCSQANDNKTAATEKDSLKKNAVIIDTVKATANKSMVDLATILSQKEVPVLCYHHIRPIKPTESESMKSY